jgi:hypothetical protein
MTAIPARLDLATFRSEKRRAIPLNQGTASHLLSFALFWVEYYHLAYVTTRNKSNVA